MDFDKEKLDWQEKPTLKVAAIVSTLDSHIANCPPKCKGACDLKNCPLGKGHMCMHRHLLDAKVKLQQTPVTEIASKTITAIETAKLLDQQMKAELQLAMAEEEPKEKP